MASGQYRDVDQDSPYKDTPESQSRTSIGSASSLSSTSVVLQHMNEFSDEHRKPDNADPRTPLMDDEKEAGYYVKEKGPTRSVKVILWSLCAFCLVGWLLALFLFLKYGTALVYPTTPGSNTTSLIQPSLDRSKPVGTIKGNPKSVQFDEVLGGEWFPSRKEVSWIQGSDGDDGMIMERSKDAEDDHLVVKDVRSMKKGAATRKQKTLMKSSMVRVNGRMIFPREVYPSPDLKKVLLMSHKKKNWRHSSTGLFWIFDVETQSAEPLDPEKPTGRIQLATWSPTSKEVVFTRDNNMFLRRIHEKKVIPITTDGGKNLFYGVPDWVYEEEVFKTKQGTWWSDNGEYIAFLRTNETEVPEFPVQYFVSRPSGTKPKDGLENYPEVRQIKYPKAGAPNPVVNVKFYDVKKKEMFDVKIDNDYPDNDRLVTEVVWAGRSGKVLMREANRESDTFKVVLIDPSRRVGKTIREEDIKGVDGGWFEVSESTKFIPSDPGNGRDHDGYIDTVINNGYLHLAYFTPLDNPKPIHLTSGNWEVVNAPSSVDLNKNLVYFVAAKKGPIHRHVYSVKLDGTEIKAVTDDSVDAYYDASFSTGSAYALLTYRGPEIPSQKIITTESLERGEPFEATIEANRDLADKAAETDLPVEIYSTVNIDGNELQVVERRPKNFNEKKKYPVVFHLYNGPASQTVDKRFKVDFQAYMASNLEFIVVTVDGRGTGYAGRKIRCAIRDNIGYYESRDQIETAKIWKAKPYVDPEKIAIWGWSYGGFLTLKTLERDAGETFKYGVAVAPVTDWRFYDSVYTERYMHMPQHNPGGYDNATISDMQALSKNVRFLMMHGVADDNVHFQSSLTLLDKLDLAGVKNYDFHAFPDSDHSIYFHNANPMVYGRLGNWLTNAFNGEWLKTKDARPMISGPVRRKR